MDQDLRPHGCALTGAFLMFTSALSGLGAIPLDPIAMLAFLIMGAGLAIIGVTFALDQPLIVGLRQRNQS